MNIKNISKERLIFFTDALIAIIVTILVLDIKVPKIDVKSDRDLLSGLINEFPHLISFVISFAAIITIWFTHHDLMELVSHTPRTFAILNFALVGFLSTIPFSAALVGEYLERPLAVAILGGNMLLMNLVLTALFRYSYSNNLIDAEVAKSKHTMFKRKLAFTGLLVFMVSIFIAYLSPTIALIMIALVPILHIIPFHKYRKNRTDRIKNGK